MHLAFLVLLCLPVPRVSMCKRICRIRPRLRSPRRDSALDCAAIPGETIPGFTEAQEESVADPLESWNRAMFIFNDKIYFWAMKPAIRDYNKVVPEAVRKSVRNFFLNLEMPVRFVSSLLQAQIVAMGIELARFHD